MSFILPQVQGISVFLILNRRSAFAAATPLTNNVLAFPNTRDLNQSARLKTSRHQEMKRSRERGYSVNGPDDNDFEEEDRVPARQSPRVVPRDRFVPRSPGLGPVGSPKPTGAREEEGVFEKFAC